MDHDNVGSIDFEGEVFRYLEDLRQTACMFSEKGIDDECQVIATYAEAFRSRDILNSRAECKTWLFKILIKKLLVNGRQNSGLVEIKPAPTMIIIPLSIKFLICGQFSKI